VDNLFDPLVDFGDVTRRIYFDNSATTKLDERVLKAMMPFLTEHYGNASSLHSLGTEAAVAMDNSRRLMAEHLGAKTREIVFTSGGTESDNLALKGIALANRANGRHIITSAIEHHAVLHSCHHLEEMGFEVTYLPVDSQGLVSPDNLRKEIRGDTVLISIMTANNEIGTIQPIEEIGKIARERGITFHTDAVQSITKAPVDMGKAPIDLLSLSGHKFHGPKGIGALYLREGIEITPLLHGGGHERGLRSSTENIPGIVGMATALEISMRDMKAKIDRMRRMRDTLIEGVLEEIPATRLNGHPERRLCNNAHFCFEGIDGKDLVIELDSHGIATSTASACSTKDPGPSHVLTAIGLSPRQAKGSLRISLSWMNDMEEVEALLGILPGVVGRLRG